MRISTTFLGTAHDDNQRCSQIESVSSFSFEAMTVNSYMQIKITALSTSPRLAAHSILL
jgi:hypothetical protein